MKKKLKSLLKTCTALVCAVSICTLTLIVRADDSVDSLTKKTSDLQNRLDNLNNQLTELSAEITDLAVKIEETDNSIAKAELDLTAAKLNEQLQYDAMKKRIKYMYESGNTSLLEILFSSESMGEFLNNTEFVRNVTEYDRNMLNDLQEIHKEIAEKEQALKDEQEELAVMKEDMESRRNSLNTAISTTSGDLKASADALSKAKAAEAAAQEALKEQAAAENNSASSGGGGQSSGGNSGSITVDPTPADTNELVLFAAILECEAGTSDYNALLAVATVIMNRVASGSYPGTVTDVIYQRGQFSPTWNGSLNKALQRGPCSLSYQVAQDALNGKRLSAVSGCYSFRASWTGYSGVVIGDNVFF
ncbi:MAG: cell wall hydrolase [Coprococcus sp.]|nr:cell wall hydrolase [Coprococcus sp.]